MQIWMLSSIFFSALLIASDPLPDEVMTPVCKEEISEAVPDLLSVATGVYDLYRAKHRTFEFEIEYKFHFNCLEWSRIFQFRPLIGVMATAQGSFYGYLGINFDLLFFKHIHFAPGFAAGYFAPGGGKNLGYPLEFRSGVELAWQFSDWHRLGIHFYHLSNASLGRRNPGEESLVLFYDVPIVKGFPFIRENN
jgi:lipid A 3-O-deacylase